MPAPVSPAGQAALFTVCPHCQGVVPLRAATLKRGSGRITCAHCERPFNALEHLHDHYPDLGDAARRAREENAALGLSASLPDGESDPGPANPGGGQRPGRNWPWYLALALLVLVTTANLAWLFRDQLPRDSLLAQRLYAAGFSEFAPPAQFRDPALIHLVTRDIHPHPTRSDVLVLSATFVNLAAQRQPYPGLVLKLLDSDSRPLAARRLEPADYLAAPISSGQLLEPGQNVPILLEFSDPGARAVGFVLLFD